VNALQGMQRTQRRMRRRFIWMFALGALLVMVDPADAQSRGEGRHSDAAITSHITQSLARDTRFRGSQLNVATRNGVVVLTGSAGSLDAQRAAESLARSTAGVRAVVGGHSARSH
jgi:hypothetical protein